VSFNGGTGGVSAKPTADEAAAAKDKHIAPTALQTQHEHAASTNHALLASVNNGKPSIAATAKAGQFSGQGIVAAKGFHASKSLDGAKQVSGQNFVAARGTHPAKPLDGSKIGQKTPGQFKAAKISGTPGTKPPQYKPKKPEHDAAPNR
jgi:hypothetical protein